MTSTAPSMASHALDTTAFSEHRIPFDWGSECGEAPAVTARKALTDLDTCETGALLDCKSELVQLQYLRAIWNLQWEKLTRCDETGENAPQKVRVLHGFRKEPKFQFLQSWAHRYPESKSAILTYIKTRGSGMAAAFTEYYDDFIAAHQDSHFFWPGTKPYARDLVGTLVDLPRVNRIAETAQMAEDCILEILKQRNPPHVPLHEGEFRLAIFEPISDDPEDEIEEWEKPLRLRLENYPLSRSTKRRPRYSTLSYCWGPAIQDQKVIFLDHGPWVINVSLFDALKAHRPYGKEDLIWVDALCIRQDDFEEKALQIPCMSRIYYLGTCVQVWLGNDADDSVYTMNTIYNRAANAKYDARFLKGFNKFLQRPWFQRIWIIQELTTSRQAFLRTEFGFLRWEELVAFIDKLGDIGTGYAMFLNQHGREASGWTVKNMQELVVAAFDLSIIMGSLPFVKRLDTTRRWVKETDKTDSVRSLLLPPMLLQHKAWKATDHRDKVYGLAGICGSPCFLDTNTTISYHKTIGQVYHDLTKDILQRNREDHAIFFLSWPLWYTNSKSLEEPYTPSWTLDFSYDCWWHAEMDFVSRYDDITEFSGHTITYELDDSGTVLKLPASVVDEITDILPFPCQALAPNGEVDNYGSRRIGDVTRTMRALDIFANDEEVQSNYFGWSHGFEQEYSLVDYLRDAAALHSKHTSRSSDWIRAQHEPLWKILAVARAEHLIREAGSEQRASELFETLIGGTGYNSQITNSGPMISYMMWTLGHRSAGSAWSFFVTRSGLGGLCMPGAKVGDEVAVLFRESGCEIPYVLQPVAGAHDTYKMVCVAYLPDSWKHLASWRGTLESKLIHIV